jgi:hypothetical protein
VPNDEATKAIEAAPPDEGKAFDTVEELFADLHADFK